MTSSTDADQAVRAAQTLGWPVVLKSAVPGLAHKSDAGGVLLDLRNEAALREAYARLARLGPEATVSPMVRGRIELAFGMVQDPQFGLRLHALAGALRGLPAVDMAARARDFADEVLLPLEQITDDHGEVPMELREDIRRKVRDWGFAGINHSKENGGLGLSMLEQTAIEEQLGRVTNGLWSCVWRPPVSLKSGTGAQRERWLRPSCRGHRRGAFAITEEGAGSDPRQVQTRAVRRGGEWLLTGVKWFVTSYNASDFVIVHAHASALKLHCSEMAGRVIDRALQILGGRGYMRENPVERLYRDIRVDRIREGTSEIQRVVIAGQIRKRGLGTFADIGATP